MKKLGFRRIALFLLLQLLVGAAFYIISNLLKESTFSIEYLNKTESYKAGSIFDADEEFNSTNVYNSIYTNQLKDIIEYNSVKKIYQGIENNSYRKVDVVNFTKELLGNDYHGVSVSFSIDDLLRWQKEGFEYETLEFNESDFLEFYDIPTSIQEIQLYSADAISVRNDNVGKKIISIKLLKPLVESSGIVTDLKEYADDWISLIELQNSVVYTASKYDAYYETYKKGKAIYDNHEISLKYLIIVSGNRKQCFTNILDSSYDFASLSDEMLVDIFSEKNDYLIYYPAELEYSTFSNIDESELYTTVRLCEDEYEAPIKIYAYIDGVFDKDYDAFSKAYSVLSVRRKTLNVYMICLISLFLLYFGGLFLLAYKTENQIFLVDKVIYEFFIIALLCLIYLANHLYKTELASHFSWIYGLVGVLAATALSFSVISLVRRIKAKSFKKYSLFFICSDLVEKLNHKLENSTNLYIKSQLGYQLFMIANFVLIIASLLFYLNKNYVLFIASLIVLSLIDFDAGYRKYKKANESSLLVEGINRIGKGELDYKINTEDLSKNTEEIAVAINNIGENISNAVNNSMRDEKIKSDLITNVSHDLKTPLTSIINYVALLKDEKITAEPAAGYIQVLEEKSIRLKQLLEDLIEASRLSSGQTPVDKQRLVVDEFLKQAVAEYVDQLDERHLTVIYDINCKAFILADGRLLWRIFDNLLGNVIKYALEGTRVYAAVSCENGEVTISIKNVSATTNLAQGNELTERFIRGDASRSSEGSGLGLYIAKTLTQIQDGEFEVVADGDLFKVNLTFKEA